MDWITPGASINCDSTWRRRRYIAVWWRERGLLQTAGLDWIHVNGVVYAGGSACLPGLNATLAVHLREDVITLFATGTMAGGGIGDPTDIRVEQHRNHEENISAPLLPSVQTGVNPLTISERLHFITTHHIVQWLGCKIESMARASH
jgi:hypothetical protein